ALMKYTNPQNPVRMLTKGVKISDLFLQVRINADAALLKALLLMMWQAELYNPGEVFDHEFIEEKSIGYKELIEHLATQDLDNLIAQTGIPRKQIEQAADLLINKKRIVICWAMGITQHENGIDNVREIVNILLLKGSIGILGGGTCPVRGHSNVQGDRTVGVWEKLKPGIAEGIRKTFGFEPPLEEGYDTVGTVRALYEGKLKVFFGMGGNFVPATPDTDACAAGMRKTNLTVHVSTKLNRSHLIHGKRALILPCLGRTEIDVQAEGEQFVSVENSVGVVHSSQGVLSPVSEHLKSEVAIICAIAEATLGERSVVAWDNMTRNYDHIRDAIETTIPAGFDNYNKRVRIPMGFYLNNGARKQEFHTPSGKAVFTINQTSQIQLADNEFLLTTLRSHDQFNTTIYGLNDRYRGIAGERRVLMMNKKDIKNYGLKKRQVVDIVSEYDGVQRWARQFLVVPYSIPESNVAVYFPEGNALVPIDRTAGRSNTPNSKSVVVKIVIS
ncbi:MAG: molybdopterin dinucleotide binding domain-containing protein, partial [Saprospiraceae bacterium]